MLRTYMQNDKKRARLAELGRTSYVSKSGMATLLHEFLSIPDDELPEHLSRSTIMRACADVQKLDTPYGLIFQTCELRTRDGELGTVHYLSPMPLFWHLVMECAPFREAVKLALERHPPSLSHPWRIALYSDEVLPGNQLKHFNHRKIQAIYWTFVELGDLGNENIWMPWSYTKSEFVNRLEGGMSQLMRPMLRSFFDSNGHNITLSGLLLRLDDVSILIRAVLEIKVADESALHQVYMCMGSGGNLPCLKCSNVYSRDSGLAAHRADAVSTMCLDIGKFIFHTNESLRWLIRTLSTTAATAGITALREFETRVGFHHCPEGLLSDEGLVPYLRPADILMYDWCHIFLVSGLFQLFMGLFMRLAHPHVLYSDCDAFVRKWRLPLAHESSAAGLDVACAKRATASFNDDTFKCSASEGLGVYPILRVWIRDVIRPHVARLFEACTCLLLLFDVLDLLKRTQRMPCTVTGPTLHKAIVAMLTKFLEVFGEDAWIPKCHMAMHLGHHLHIFGVLISCFVHERKHKLAKRFGNAMSKLHKFELYVLREVFLTQRAALRHGGCFARYHHTSKPSKKAMTVLREAFPNAALIEMTADAWVGIGGKVSKRDIVWLEDGRVAEVWLHAIVDHILWSCVSALDHVGGTTYNRAVSHPEFLETHSIAHALTYTASDAAVTIIPPLL